MASISPLNSPISFQVYASDPRRDKKKNERKKNTHPANLAHGVSFEIVGR
jgi:hypothetical protein